MENLISIDDQPISATFFGEGRWLSDFITPNALEIQELYKALIEEIEDQRDRIANIHQWVASQIRYKRFIKGKLWIEGKSSTQSDLWNRPSITARVRVGNCANKSFLMASILRNELSAEKVFCVLGNLYNGKPGGHAWVQAILNGDEYIIETTRADVPALVPVVDATRYEAVHLFNDQEAMAVKGRTVMEPMSACYSTWLKDYLDWAYIEGRK